MNDKKFTMTVMAIFATLTLTIVSFNYWMDPLWSFGHAHAYNDVQIVTDEREQKTGNQKFVSKDANTLLIGSSRSTYIHTTGFKKWNVYNYSVANLSMQEYQSMMLYSFKQNPDYERVILGVDFFKSSTQEAGAHRSIGNYEAKVEKPFYRAKNLFSYDVLKYSVDNFKLSSNDDIARDRLYNRQGNAFAKKLTEEETFKETVNKITKFEDTFYGEHYVYFPKYKEVMTNVRDTHPEAEKIVYTTPISSELFKALVYTDLLDDYEMWMRDLVDVYGGVWNFMYPNEVTNNINNYFDGHHFYPEVGDLIAARVEQGESADVPEDFGVYVTAENVDEHLEDVKKLVAEFQK